MAQGHRATRPGMEEAGPSHVQSARRYAHSAPELSQSDPRSRYDSAHRPGHDGPARFRVPGQAVGVTPSGRAARAPHGSAGQDQGSNVEVGAYGALPRLFGPARKDRGSGVESEQR